MHRSTLKWQRAETLTLLAFAGTAALIIASVTAIVFMLLGPVFNSPPKPSIKYVYVLPPDQMHRYISNMIGHRHSNVVAEMEKCEVVCANCHRLRTESRRGLKDKALVF